MAEQAIKENEALKEQKRREKEEEKRADALRTKEHQRRLEEQEARRKAELESFQEMVAERARAAGEHLAHEQQRRAG